MKHKKYSAGLQNVYTNKPTSARELRNAIAENRANTVYIIISLFTYGSVLLSLILLAAKISGAEFSWFWPVFPLMIDFACTFVLIHVIVQTAHNNGIDVSKLAASDYPVKRKLSILFGASYKGKK